MDWQREIEELHDFFEVLFLGNAQSLDRAASVLSPHFTHVDPEGTVSDRDKTLASLHAGRGHTDQLTISISGCQLLHETDDVVVAEYLEHHQLKAGSNTRRTTVVFQKDETTPHGVVWLRAHESWVDRQPARRVDQLALRTLTARSSPSRAS